MSRYGYWWIYFFAILAIAILNWYLQILLLDCIMGTMILLTTGSEAYKRCKNIHPRVENRMLKQVKLFWTVTFSLFSAVAGLLGAITRDNSLPFSVSNLFTILFLMFCGGFFFHGRVLFWTIDH